MFLINEDDKSIYLTRGDTALFQVSAMKSETERYVFQPGDVVRIKVFEKKACENVVLQKCFGIEKETDIVTIYLDERDTKIGEVISKPKDYWYEIELNPFDEPQTIVGYDDDGAKVLKLFPEGADVEDTPIEEEDIPVVDTKLDQTSTRPVQNQAIAKAIIRLQNQNASGSTSNVHKRIILIDSVTDIYYELTVVDGKLTMGITTVIEEDETVLVITQQPQNVAFEEGGSGTFYITATGEGLTYQWQYSLDGGKSWGDGATTRTYTLTREVTGYEATFHVRCIVTDSHGNSVTSDVVTCHITVKENGSTGGEEGGEVLESTIQITSHPQSVTVEEDGVATFKVVATGTGLTYQWQFSTDNGYTWYDVGSYEGSGQSASYQIQGTKASNGNQYRCVVSDANNTSKASEPATLTVNEKIETLAITQQPQDVTLEAGDSGTFYITATGTELKYLWQYSLDSGNTWRDAVTTESYTITTEETALDSTFYIKCIVTDAYGNSITSEIAKCIVTAKPDEGGDDEEVLESTIEIVSHPASVTATEGEVATFNVVATGTGMTYQWQFSSDNGSSWLNVASYNGSGENATYTVEASDLVNGYQYRCVITDANNTSKETNPATLTVNEKVVEPETYELKITSHPQSITVEEGDSAVFSVIAETTAPNATISYKWQYKASGTSEWMTSGIKNSSISFGSCEQGDNGMQIRCTVSDGVNDDVVSNVATLYVVTQDSIQINKQPEDVTVENGGVATFSVEATGTGLTYQWQYTTKTGTVWFNVPSYMGSGKDKSFSISGTSASNGNKYRCVITDAYGNTFESDSATLTVILEGIIITQQPQNTTAVDGEATFRIVAETSVSGATLSYEWQRKEASWSESASWYSDGPRSDNYKSYANLTAEDNGRMIRCIVRDGVNEVVSDVAILTVPS